MNTPDHIRNAANSICDISDTEEMYRSAISRLYYSAFHHCRDFDNRLKYISNYSCSGGMHRNFIFRLSNPDGRLDIAIRAQSIMLGKALGDLYDKRIDADYHLDKTVSKDDMLDASDFFDKIFDYQ